MILEITKTNLLWKPLTYCTIKGEGDVIEKITINGEELDLKSDEDLVRALDAVIESKNSANFSTDEYSAVSNLFGNAFGDKLSTLIDRFNELTEDLIYKIEQMRFNLKNSNAECRYTDTKCSCDDVDYCAQCEEASKAAEAVEAVSNTRTFTWAQKYMDEVIDPASELSGPEYNTLLAMFTQYGEWILNQ